MKVTKKELMKLVKEVIDRKLNEAKINRPPEELNMTRKPTRLSEVDTMKYSEQTPEVQKWLDSLQQYMPNQLWNNTKIKLFTQFDDTPDENFFIINIKGDSYLVNTEGHDYMRLMKKIEWE